MTFLRSGGYDIRWRRGDLVGLIVLSAFLGSALIYHSGLNRLWFTDQPGVYPTRIFSARQKIDPNTATIASLRRLDRIGPVLARAIVAYRRTRPQAFRRPEDLTGVHGIGPGIVNRMRPHLSFSKSRPLDSARDRQ